MYYQTHIGNKFVKHYNMVNNTNYTNEEFFIQVFAPIIYDNDIKLIVYLNHTITGPKSAKLYSDKIKNYNAAIKSNERCNMTVLAGGPTLNLINDTASQFDDIYPMLSVEECFANLIGDAFSIQTAGYSDHAYFILIDDMDILLKLFNGWNVLKKFISNNPSILNSNQLRSFNGLYLYHISQNLPVEQFRLMDGYIEKGVLRAVKWNKLIFGVYKLSTQNIVNSYLYYIASSKNPCGNNKTIGLVPIKRHDITRILDCYDKLYNVGDVLSSRIEIEEYFGTEYPNIKDAACYTYFGIQSLKPKDPVLKTKEELNQLSINAYTTWIMVQLNDTKFKEFADKFSDELLNLIKQDKSATTVKMNFIEKKFLNPVYTYNQFINSSTELVKLGFNTELVNDIVNYALTFNDLKKLNILLSLIKFQFTYKQLNTKENEN